ncbi:hypothetical protein AOLI_G00226770 [Acnodon oligacanthus]
MCCSRSCQTVASIAMKRDWNKKLSGLACEVYSVLFFTLRFRGNHSKQRDSSGTPVTQTQGRENERSHK